MLTNSWLATDGTNKGTEPQLLLFCNGEAPRRTSELQAPAEASSTPSQLSLEEQALTELGQINALCPSARHTAAIQTRISSSPTKHKIVLTMEEAPRMLYHKQLQGR